jgi:hypothetical protein
LLLRDSQVSRPHDARNQALEEAARVVELVRMPPGDKPVMLFEVRAEIAKAIRRLMR